MCDRLDRLVERLLSSLGVPSIPPINVHMVAERMGVREISVKSLLEDGRLEHRPGATRIVLNEASSPQRRRFTLAHELGHLLLVHPESSVTALRTYPNLNDEERFCDAFAGSLLLPRSWITATFGSAPPSIATLRAIADRANTSLAATAVRANGLLSRERALLRWRDYAGTWRLVSCAGLPAILHGRINTSPATLSLLASLASGETKLTEVPVLLSGTDQTLIGEVWISRRRQAAIGLLNTSSYTR